MSWKDENYSPGATATEDPAEGLCDVREAVITVIPSYAKPLPAPTFSEKQKYTSNE